MTIFLLALVIGLATAAVYVTLAVQAFLRVRREILAGVDQHAESAPESDRGYRHFGWKAAGGVVASTLLLGYRHFGWKAAGGVVASTLLLVLVSTNGLTWYLLPLLAIGSSIAVIIAFLLDRPR
jgi:hypothetical protein